MVKGKRPTTDTSKAAKAKAKAKRKPIRRHLKIHKHNKKLQAKVHDLENMITCPVCYERNKNIVLECGHAICLQCWNKLLGFNLSARCPMDRQSTFIVQRLYL